MVIGVSYSFFSYYRQSDKNNQLITGQIYLSYNEGVDAISLSDKMPESDVTARGQTDNVVTFTIDGINTTTNKDVYYEILLSYGDGIDGKNRINDDCLRFDLVETRLVDGIETENTVLSGVNYDTLNNKRIWVNTIDRNTTEEIVTTYQLRMWISDDVLISDTDSNADYTTSEYKDCFASIKVGVNADFNVKTVE